MTAKCVDAPQDLRTGMSAPTCHPLSLLLHWPEISILIIRKFCLFCPLTWWMPLHFSWSGDGTYLLNLAILHKFFQIWNFIF